MERSKPDNLQSTAADSLIDQLSLRQRDIAIRYAQGLTHKQIATELSIAPATVRNHIATIYRHLGVSNKADLIKTMALWQSAAPTNHHIDATPEDRQQLAGGSYAYNGYALTSWLHELGLDQYVDVFDRNAIDWQILATLDDNDLQTLGIETLAHRKRLQQAIARLSDPPNAAPSAVEGAQLMPVQAERRQLTVLFCALVDSESLISHTDPEDLAPLLRRYRDACTDAVSHFQAHIANYSDGGALTIYFGWPQANEDAAERALRAGLAIIDAVRSLPPKADARLQVRIGIATGLVVVDKAFSTSTMPEQAVVGPVPSQATQLQSLAEPGSLVISESTLQLVDTVFDTVDLGTYILPGSTESVQAFRVLGVRAREIQTPLYPLIPLAGRGAELYLLRDRWQQALAGEALAVLLCGEAGIGKSRLVRAFNDELEEQTYHLINFSCSSYYSHSPLYPILQQLSEMADFTDSDNHEAKLAKLKSSLALSSAYGQRVAPLLAMQLGISVTGYTRQVRSDGATATFTDAASVG